jgi:hypothetical protein
MLPCFGRERYRTLSHRWLPMAGGDRAILAPHTSDWLVNIAHSGKFNEFNQFRGSRIHRSALRRDAPIHGTAQSHRDCLGWGWQMPHYFFDIKDGHRLVNPAGSECKNDSAAMEKARVLAIGVSLDKPAVDPKRRISAGCGKSRKFPRCRFMPGQPSSARAIGLAARRALYVVGHIISPPACAHKPEGSCQPGGPSGYRISRRSRFRREFPSR